MKGFAEHIKLALTVAFVLLLGILSAVRLMKIQIVGDDEIIKNPQSNSGAFVYTKNIKFSDKFLFIFSTFQLLFASVQ